MKLSDWDRSGEVVELIGGISGFLAVVGLVGCAVLAVDYLPMTMRCCDDGEPYYAPSTFMQIAALILFPLTMLIGLVVGFFLDYWPISVATMALIFAWFGLKALAMDLESKVQARFKRERDELYERNRSQND